MLFFKIVELKLLRQQLRLLEDIFIPSANQKKIEFYVLRILFMAEPLLQFLQVDQKMTEGFGPKVPGFDHINFGDTKPRFQI